jgi:hypothetical protein
LASSALAATAISVSSTAGTLGVAGAGECTLRDALVVADIASNPALSTSAEPGGSGAGADCTGEVSGTGAPYTITLVAGATYSLDSVDNYWFGPDGLPPVSTVVTIVGNDPTIVRASASRAFRFFYVSGGLSGIPAGSLVLDQLYLSGGLAHGGSADGGGAGAGMGGAIFDQGQLALSGVTLTDNAAVGGSGHVPALDAYVQKVFSGDPGSGGGGIGRDAYVNGRGGGFGGLVPGARGGRGGARDDGSRYAGGGGGFRAQDRGADGRSGGRGGGPGGFGSNGGDGGDAGFSHGNDGAPYTASATSSVTAASPTTPSPAVLARAVAAASAVGAASVPVVVASVVVAATPRCFALEDVTVGGVASAAAVPSVRAAASAQAPESRARVAAGALALAARSSRCSVRS